MVGARAGLIACMSALLMSAPVLAQTADARRYDWLTTGEKSGELIVEQSGSSLSYTFSFNDRGRGPEIRAHYRLNESGVPVSITVTGKNYEKGDAAEQFSLTGSVARWTAAGNTVKRSVSEPALYALQGWAPPEHTAVLARALLQDADKRMPLLPGGELRIEAVKTRTFEGAKSAVNATLYALYGASPYADYIWLDERRELFGADYGWFAVAREGYSGTLSLMKADQDAAKDARTEALSARFAHDASGVVVIRGAKVFDSLKARWIPRATVIIRDGVIAAVHRRPTAIPAGAKVIEAAGKALLPAFWDMHAHIDTRQLFNYVAAGVLSIRDMANDPTFILKLQKQVSSETVAGPDVHAMGFIDKRSPYSAPTGRLADTLDEALGHVDWYARNGFRGIKLYSSIEPAWVEPIAKAAHARGLTVLGHIPSGMTAEEAIRAGYDEVTHINMLFLNFVDNAKQVDTRSPQRFTSVIREGGRLDLESPAFARMLRLMKQRKVAHDPTFTIFQEMFENVPGRTMLSSVRFREHLPADEQSWFVAAEGFNKGLETEGLAASATAKRLIARLHSEGIRILPGTDTGYPGFVLLRELELLAAAGIPGDEVLQLATIGAARHMGSEKQIGSITRGKKAYLVLVNGDPSRNLADLLKAETVLKGSKMFRSAEIHGALGIRPF